jgi:signal peptidase I
MVVLLVVLAFSWLVSGTFLWLSCKCCRATRPAPAGGPGLMRSLLVSVSWCMVNLAAGAALLGQEELLDRQPLLALAVLGAYAVLVLVWLRIGLGLSLGKTVLVTLVWHVFLAVYSAGLVFALPHTVGDLYKVPTGNMADTLWGLHRLVRCPRCDIEFAVNASSEEDPSGPRVSGCTCPNCRQTIHFPHAPAAFVEQHPQSIEAADPGVRGGDRIMVGQGLLGGAWVAPARLDVIAFRFPAMKPGASPDKYVKRLVGLPGETVAIHAGKLFVLPADKGLKYDEGDEPGSRREPPFMHANDTEAEKRFEQGQFEIVRKSPDQVLKQRRLVYDNDHPARDLKTSRWTGGGWTKDGNGFTIETRGGGQERHWLTYRHLLRGNGDKPQLVTDFSGYNTYVNERFHTSPPGENWAGDLILECEVVPENGSGELVLELTKGVDRFQARFDLDTGDCALCRVTADGETKLESKPTALKATAGKPSFTVRFANVDRQLIVWVDGKLVFGAQGVAYEAPASSGPTANDLEPARIGARNADVQVRGLKLWRDVYYTAAKSGRPSDPDVANVDFADPAAWGPLNTLPVSTYYVQPGHYFVLGDNSPECADSRSWGLIPAQDLLGRVFFVYYPFSRAGRVR